MKKKCFKKGGSAVDFNVNAVELTTEELKTKVNGGAALTTEQQMEMARRAAKGDYSLPDFITGKTDDSKETKDEVPVTKTPASKTGGNTTYTPAKTDTDDVPSVVNDDVDTKKKKDVGGKSTALSTEQQLEMAKKAQEGDYSKPTSVKPEDIERYDLGMEKDDDQSWEMEIDYKKNDSKKMSVTIRTKNKDGTYDYSNGKVKTIYFDDVTNKVKTPGERNAPVNFRDYYYYPVQFPEGTWNITETVSNLDIRTYGPCAIRTDASIYLDKYNKDGTEIEGSVLDSGYLIHTGESATTWGCIKMGNDKDLINLFNITDTVLSSGGKATIRVC